MGQQLGRAWLPGLGFWPLDKREAKKQLYAPGGTRTPDPGLIRPMLYQLSYQSCAAHARDRTKNLQIFSLTLSQLGYMGVHWRKLCVVHPSFFFFFRCSDKNKSATTAPAGN